MCVCMWCVRVWVCTKKLLLTRICVYVLLSLPNSIISLTIGMPLNNPQKRGFKAINYGTEMCQILLKQFLPLNV